MNIADLLITPRVPMTESLIVCIPSANQALDHNNAMVSAAFEALGLLWTSAKAHGQSSTLFRSAEAPLPPHECGGSHRPGNPSIRVHRDKHQTKLGSTGISKRVIL